MKIFVVMDSTDSWSGETTLYRAFRTEEAARRFLSEVKKVPLDLYDKRWDKLSKEEIELLTGEEHWYDMYDYLDNHHLYIVQEVELEDG